MANDIRKLSIHEVTKLPDLVTVDHTKGAVPLLIDGQPFPWYLSADEGIHVSLYEPRSGIQQVTITLLAERVRVIPE
ncbi:hypothetical protein [Arthrobacter woluwensis]|uniref:Uncharacterized protein n=1 Tax=Arthrobacter woluwensis TaxID=156980 RepID=A0A1H4WBK0_9MICC|nr:hypothetical protein [Arthrobacter woluwensis]SEC54531.1 hypothetical protein SAMN04489745_3141 [Arthrobacter woluwensis]SEC90762.1 hypothetical protein SAMN04489745_3482 [Arthrobacter woluwensis]